MLFRIYIGSNNKTKKLEAKRATSIIAKHFQGFTVTLGNGYWQGQAEKTLIAEIETNNINNISTLSKELCKELKQQAIGVAKIGQMRFISL